MSGEAGPGGADERSASRSKAPTTGALVLSVSIEVEAVRRSRYSRAACGKVPGSAMLEPTTAMDWTHLLVEIVGALELRLELVDLGLEIGDDLLLLRERGGEPAQGVRASARTATSRNSETKGTHFSLRTSRLRAISDSCEQGSCVRTRRA